MLYNIDNMVICFVGGRNMTTIKASDTRIPPRIFGEVAYGGGRVRVTKNGVEEIFLVSKADIEILQRLEDRYWAETAQKVIDEAKAKGESPIPWDDVKKELEL
jgi:hypothetical protein